jgi:hypothetical protein
MMPHETGVTVKTISSIFQHEKRPGQFGQKTSDAQVHFVGGLVFEKGPPLPPNTWSSTAQWNADTSVLLSGVNSPWCPDSLLSTWQAGRTMADK